MARAPIKPRQPPQGTDHVLTLEDGVGTDDRQHPSPPSPAQNLEPEPVYTPPPAPPRKARKERPEMPGRFLNGGASAEEREAWVKENWGG